jgi:glyoxylase-like metal-dependent hydrolase (beta-lactamase superfamily II)
MINVKEFVLGPIQTNCFLIYNDHGQALVIDPGGEADPILHFLKSQGLQLLHILNTHFHIDHIYGNKELQQAVGVSILANPEDDFLLKTEIGSGGPGIGLPSVDPFDYDPLHPGQQEWLGEKCHVISTPGHSPGSLSFYFPESQKIFSGDVLFHRSIGRTDLPGGDAEVLLRSVRERIFTLPGETIVYCGHGPKTTVHDEKHFNPFFQGKGMMF